MAIFGRFLLHGNVADVYNILSCVKKFTGIIFFNRDKFFNALINVLINALINALIRQLYNLYIGLFHRTQNSK